MPRRIDQLTPWKKGDPSPNPAGRPRKLITELKGVTALKECEIRDAYLMVVNLTKEELTEVCEDEAQPIILRILSKSLLFSLRDGTQSQLNDIFGRALGAPKTTSESTVTLTAKQEITLPDGSKLEI